MSLEAIRSNIAGLQVAFAELESATVSNTETRRNRASSVMAKNLNHGDVIQWPYHDGKVEIIGWSRTGSDVGVTSRDGTMATFGANERVRVYHG